MSVRKAEDPNDAFTVDSRLLRESHLKGVSLPTYDRGTLVPAIVHIGVGAFHRAHQARYIDQLCQQQGLQEWGILGVGIMPQDAALSQALQRQDCLYSLTERSGQEDHCRLVGSLVSHLLGSQDPAGVFEAIAAKETKIISLTVTEGGYYIDESTGELDLAHHAVAHDLRDSRSPTTVFGYLLQGLMLRRSRGHGPVSILSCDNIQHNGDVVRNGLHRFASRVAPAMADWIASSVSFPNCMVDRITPAAGAQEGEFVERRFALKDLCPVICESFSQWVIEDTFIAGRPPLERVGVQFVDDVAPFERMKLRLLNATHSAMGYLGCLRGYEYIHEVAQAPEFEAFLDQLMEREMIPLVGSVPGTDLHAYKRDLLKRFRNQDVRDTVLRICSNGSAKIPAFILPAVREALDQGTSLRALACTVAGWLRCCSGEDQQGHPIAISDPLADRLRATARRSQSDPAGYLAMREIFGDLRESPRFVETLDHYLKVLYQRGAEAALQEFAT